MSNSTPRILIWGWHHDSNKGDAAIVRGLLLSARPNCEPLHLTLVAGVRRGNPVLPSLLRHPLGVGVSARVLPSPLVVDRDDRGVQRIARGLASLAILGALLLVPAAFVFGDTKRLIEEIKAADAVVAKGGHYLYSRPGISGFLAFLLSVTPLLLSVRLRKTILLAGLTIGPFRGFAARRLMGTLLRRARAVSVRDAGSFKVLRELDVPLSRAYLGTDLAFALASPISTVEPAKTLLVNIRGFDPEGADQQREWLAALQAVLAAVLSRNPAVDIQPLVTAAAPEALAQDVDVASEDDRGATRELFAALGLSSPPLDTEADVSPEQLVGRIAVCAASLAVRLHAGLLTLIAGRPCILIDYTGTKAKVFEEIGLGAWLTSVQKLKDPLEVSRVSGLLLDFIDRPTEARQQVARAVEAARERLHADAALIELRTILNVARD